MELRVQQSKSWTATVYTAPISVRGCFVAWKGQHTGYKHGFVLRALWFGLVVRWGYIPGQHAEARRQRRVFDALAEAADFRDPREDESPGLRTAGGEDD